TVSGDSTHRFGAESTSGAAAKDVGVAGSFSLNLVHLDTTAALRSTSSLDAGNGDVSLRAASTSESIVKAQPRDGGATGSTVGHGSLLTLSGKIDAKATQTASVLTTAEGAAKGDVAIGAALALTIADHSVTATTLRDLTVAGSASFQAFGSSATLAATVASAA